MIHVLTDVERHLNADWVGSRDLSASLLSRRIVRSLFRDSSTMGAFALTRPSIPRFPFRVEDNMNFFACTNPTLIFKPSAAEIMKCSWWMDAGNDCCAKEGCGDGPCDANGCQARMYKPESLREMMLEQERTVGRGADWNKYYNDVIIDPSMGLTPHVAAIAVCAQTMRIDNNYREWAVKLRGKYGVPIVGIRPYDVEYPLWSCSGMAPACVVD